MKSWDNEVSVFVLDYHGLICRYHFLASGPLSLERCIINLHLVSRHVCKRVTFLKDMYT